MATETDGCLTLKVSSLGNRVGGIALQDEGPVVFVRGALPGETVKVRVTATGKRHLDAELVTIISPCPERVEPFCPLHGVCGGCSLQHLDYRTQLFWKKKWIEKAFHGFSGFTLEEVVPSPLADGFRNRVTFCVSGGKPCLHAFRGDPVPVQDCPALNSTGRAVLREIWKTGIPSGVETLSVRCSISTGQSLVEVAGSVRGLPVSWGTVYERSMGIRGAQLTERLLEWNFPIPPGGFFQVNTRAAEILLDKVLEQAEGETILDLYGGVGNIRSSPGRQGRPVWKAWRHAPASSSSRRNSGGHQRSGGFQVFPGTGRVFPCQGRFQRKSLRHSCTRPSPGRGGTRDNGNGKQGGPAPGHLHHMQSVHGCPGRSGSC